MRGSWSQPYAPSRNPPAPANRFNPPPAPTSSRHSSGYGAQAPLIVTGCRNGTVSGIIQGSYTVSGKNHERAVYKKEGGATVGTAGNVNVLIYFWDDRDGPNFAGWWFGPKVGGDQVWAHNADMSAPVPPATGWKVPWDGDVDHSLRLSLGGGDRDSSRDREADRRRQEQDRKSAAEERQRVQEARAQEAQRRRDEERRVAQERERARMEERQREDAERRQAEERRREEESRRRQKEREEAENRRKAEKKKQEEEEQRRREQAASVVVRKAIQRLRMATPETYESLRADLEEAQARNADDMGSQTERVSQEADRALQQAQARIDEIIQKRAEDERRRIEEEKKRKEEQELFDRLLKEAEEEVKVAEAKVTEVTDSSKTLSDISKSTPQEIIDSAQLTEKRVEEALQELEKTLQSLATKRGELDETSHSYKARNDISELQSRVHDGRKSLHRVNDSAKTAREKASKKAAAERKEQELKETFSKYDVDGDGQWNSEEVVGFSKGFFDFEVSSELLAKIMKSYDPVTFDKFSRVRVTLGISMTEKRAAEARAIEAEKRRVLEEARQAVQNILDEASDLLQAADKVAEGAENDVRPLTRSTDLTADKIKETCASLDVAAKEVKDTILKAQAKLTKVTEECEAVADLKGFDKRDAPRLRSKIERIEDRMVKVATVAGSAKEKAVRKAYAELEEHRCQTVTALRTFMNANCKKGPELFKHIGGEAAITQEKFAAFIKELPDFELPEKVPEKLFTHIAGDSSEISQELFLDLIRMYYKCVKGTVITEDLPIKSKSVRKVDLDEVLEVLDGPTKEESANVLRVRCSAVRDSAVGWVTIAGNQGTPFLVLGGNLYKCVRETVLTDGLSVQESKTVRRVVEDEVIEVLEFGKKDESVGVTRIKGKAKLDGAIGWITVAGSQGTAYLEPC